MSKLEQSTRSIVRLSYVCAVLVAAAVAVFAGFYERQAREVQRHNSRAEVADKVSLLRSDLQGTLDANIQLIQGLAAIIAYQPDITDAQFSRLGSRLLRGQNEIRGISASPQGSATLRVYPMDAPSAALGDAPAHRRAALLARDLDATILAGPFALDDGGQGFFARAPVYLDDGGARQQFWGVVTAVLDKEALLRSAGLSDPGLPLDVVLVSREGLGAPDSIFQGDAGVLKRDPVTTTVALPYGSWKIAAIPKGDWPEPTGVWWLRGLFALGALLLVAPVLGSAMLITARHERVVAIREREAELARLSWRLELALAVSQIGVWDVDLERDQMRWDERCKALFGHPDKMGFVTEADWIGCLHAEDRDRVVREADNAVENSGKFVTEYRIVWPDGQVRHLRDVAAVYQDEDGSKRLIGLVWDVTADVERQAELNVRRLEAEAATVAKSRFLASMSHEIRTPMSGVLGVLGLMLESPLSAKQRERAEIALNSAHSLLQILNDILDFSKLEASQIRLSEEDVDVGVLLDEVVALMAAGAEQKGLTLSHKVNASVPETVVTDPMRLRQVLINLVSNATKFTETGEIAIHVGYVAEADKLEVEVSDTGIGLTEDQCGRIFQHFVQADNSLSRRAGGTGLGLAITKQLVELMGGRIGVDSKPGVGSVFRFSIYARPGALAVRPAPVAAAVRPVSAVPLHILLAEDNATNQYVINAYLRAAGHSVVTVGNGAEAVAAVSETAFDVVLMDVEMPEMDGLTATRTIRAMEGDKAAVPIIALTANAMSGDREFCIGAGMTDYLSKPIAVLELHAALQRIAEARGIDTEPPRLSASG